MAIDDNNDIDIFRDEASDLDKQLEGTNIDIGD